MRSQISRQLDANRLATRPSARGFERVRNLKEFVPLSNVEAAAPLNYRNFSAPSCGGGGGSCGKCNFGIVAIPRCRR